MKMFTQSVNSAAMEKTMSVLWQRQQTILHNIANEDTPGYIANRLSFEEILAAEMNPIRKTRAESRIPGSKEERIERINNLQPVEYKTDATVMRADGNNVDILAEQNALTKVQYQYQALAQKVTGYYQNLKYVITGSR
jgi:flagellar basal-body rod protein FlgB